MILSEKDLIDRIPVLSSTEFDAVLKEFAQFLNIQISQDVSQVLKFCGFYLKSWETLDKDHTITLNIGLPKENISEENLDKVKEVYVGCKLYFLVNAAGIGLVGVLLGIKLNSVCIKVAQCYPLMKNYMV